MRERRVGLLLYKAMRTRPSHSEVSRSYNENLLTSFPWEFGEGLSWQVASPSSLAPLVLEVSMVILFGLSGLKVVVLFSNTGFCLRPKSSSGFLAYFRLIRGAITLRTRKILAKEPGAFVTFLQLRLALAPA